MDAVRGLRLVRDEMRARGHRVVEVDGWENRGRGSVLHPRGAVNHWTAGARTGNAPSLRVVTYGREGLRNALCHTYQDRQATLYIVAARVAWHAGAGSWPGLAGNTDCLGHEPECAGPGDWRPGQLELLADLDLVQATIFNYPLGRIIDHFEWTGRKTDRSDVGGQPWRDRLVTGRSPSTGEAMFVRHGDEGEAVEYVQMLLADVGRPPVGGADGDFGDKTADAISAYWRDRHGSDYHGREVTAHVLRALHNDAFGGQKAAAAAASGLSTDDQSYLAEFVAAGRKRDAGPQAPWHTLDWLRSTRDFFSRYS